jgi:eight-cysteine-cluster-containing protein
MKKINIKVFLIGLFLFLAIGILILALTKKDKPLIKIDNSVCKKAGCSNQLCVSSDEKEVITTCEWQDEYACYQKAKCERQINGQCAFTKDEELNNCLGKFVKVIKKSPLK